jgi:hypothetical protein
MAERRKAARKSAGRTTRRRTATKKSSSSKKPSTKSKRWSQRVTKESDALDLKRGVFTLTDPKKIAASLKRSAERSSRRKTGAYRSALSMLTFYINRAGKTLPKTQRDRLQRAKDELKRQFGREGSARCASALLHLPLEGEGEKPPFRFTELRLTPSANHRLIAAILSRKRGR